MVEEFFTCLKSLLTPLPSLHFFSPLKILTFIVTQITLEHGKKNISYSTK